MCVDIPPARVSGRGEKIQQDSVMIAKVAKAFIGFQISMGLIKEEDSDVYQYGYIIMAEIALNIVISICLGIWLGEVRGIFFFLCIFLPLRSYCGGYHAKKAWKCMLLSNAVAIGVVRVAKWGAFSLAPLWVKHFIAVMCSISIIFLSPVDNENRKLDANEKKVYKRCTVKVLSIEMVLGAVMLFAGNIGFYHIILLTHAALAVSLLYASLKGIQ